MHKQLSILLGIAIIVFSCQQDTQRNTDFAIHGIDVSRYQSRINWSTVAEQGIHFAFIKATEGASHVDSLFDLNWTALEVAGIRKGAYHFYRAHTSPVLQAQHFIQQVNIKPGDLPPVLDVEVLANAQAADLRQGMLTWLLIIESHYQVKPIIYTNQKFYNKYMAGHFNDYPLWIARYNSEEPVLACGRDWAFWQYGNRGTLEGIDGYVDFNVFRTNWDDFEKLCYEPKPVLSYN